eukprot:6183831-Pleurochrysis_carterae.AAC.2
MLHAPFLSPHAPQATSRTPLARLLTAAAQSYFALPAPPHALCDGVHHPSLCLARSHTRACPAHACARSCL